MNINVEETLQRREATLMEIRVRALARAGRAVSAAWLKPISVKMKPLQFAQQWI